MADKSYIVTPEAYIVTPFSPESGVVDSVTGGAGISVSPTTGNVVVTNTGVLSLNALNGVVALTSTGGTITITPGLGGYIDIEAAAGAGPFVQTNPASAQTGVAVNLVGGLQWTPTGFPASNYLFFGLGGAGGAPNVQMGDDSVAAFATSIFGGESGGVSIYTGGANPIAILLQNSVTFGTNSSAYALSINNTTNLVKTAGTLGALYTTTVGTGGTILQAYSTNVVILSESGNQLSLDTNGSFGSVLLAGGKSEPVYTSNNTLDDGSGNVTAAGYLQVSGSYIALGTSTTTGYVLTANSSGHGTWQAAPSTTSLAWSAITAPTGTAGFTAPAGDETTITVQSTTQTGWKFTTSTVTSGTLFAVAGTGGLTSGSLFTATFSGTSTFTGNLASISSTGTHLSSTTPTGLNISISGANSNSSVTATGLSVSVTNTGTGSSNYGVVSTASGGAFANYAFEALGGGSSTWIGFLANNGSTGYVGFETAGTYTYGFYENGNTTTSFYAGSGATTSAFTASAIGAAVVGFQAISTLLTSGSMFTGSLTGTSTFTGNLMSLSSTGTHLSSTTPTGLNISFSGANSNTAVTATGISVSVTNTNATSGTNTALKLTASGATTNNYAINITAGAFAAALTTAALSWVDTGASSAVGMSLFLTSNGYTVPSANYTLSINALSISGTANSTISSGSLGSGTTTLYIGNTAIAAVSDSRLKVGIEDWKGSAMDILRSARIRSFGWDPTHTGGEARNARGQWIGMIAQETIGLMPWIVNAEDRTCYECRLGLACGKHKTEWQVEYGYAVPLLIKGLQEVDDEVTRLKARVTELENALAVRAA